MSICREVYIGRLRFSGSSLRVQPLEYSNPIRVAGSYIPRLSLPGFRFHPLFFGFSYKFPFNQQQSFFVSRGLSPGYIGSVPTRTGCRYLPYCSGPAARVCHEDRGQPQKSVWTFGQCQTAGGSSSEPRAQNPGR